MKKASILFWILIAVIPIAGIIFGVVNPEVFQQNQERLRNKIEFFGILAPLAFIFFQALQVVFTPISHYSVGILGGFLYGPYVGALLNWIGRVIGHIIAFFIARFAGRIIAEKFVQRKTLEKYDKFVSDKSLVLFLVYFLPLFPDDETSYLAGLSKMKFRMFLFANLFGHIGGSLGLAYAGSGMNTRDPLFWILTVITLAGFPILWWLLKTNKNSTELS